MAEKGPHYTHLTNLVSDPHDGTPIYYRVTKNGQLIGFPTGKKGQFTPLHVGGFYRLIQTHPGLPPVIDTGGLISFKPDHHRHTISGRLERIDQTRIYTEDGTPVFVASLSTREDKNSSSSDKHLHLLAFALNAIRVQEIKHL